MYQCSIIYGIGIIVIFYSYGVWLRHRALRSNLLSKKHSKVFPLQSPTQNNYQQERFVKWKIDFYMELLSYRKDQPFGYALLTNLKSTHTFTPNILRKHHISYQVCYVSYLICSFVFVASFKQLFTALNPMPIFLVFRLFSLQGALCLHVLDNLVCQIFCSWLCIYIFCVYGWFRNYSAVFGRRMG